jgi:hypothetical protein
LKLRLHSKKRGGCAGIVRVISPPSWTSRLDYGPSCFLNQRQNLSLLFLSCSGNLARATWVAQRLSATSCFIGLVRVFSRPTRNEAASTAALLSLSRKKLRQGQRNDGQVCGRHLHQSWLTEYICKRTLVVLCGLLIAQKKRGSEGLLYCLSEDIAVV